MIVARPTLGRRVTVIGAGREAAYAEDDGFVAVLTTGRPLLPNGVQIPRLPAVGDEVVIHGEPWDPTLRLPDDPAALGGDILAALGPAGGDVATGQRGREGATE